MCGFVALVDRHRRSISRPLLERMGARLAHRGPDGHGCHVDGHVGMFHHRLAIIDIEGGQQPMADARGDLWIVFNGEIYNHVELREELRARGARFRTRSDTEVLLEAYRAWGEHCLEHLNGMFAFFLYDRARRRAFVARDHFGIKPLYVFAGREFIAYASEIKALLVHPGVAARLDAERLQDYVTFQFVVDDGTLFEGIRKVLPGHYQIIDLFNGNIDTHRYWSPSYEVDTSYTEARALEELHALLEDTIRLQVRSDVPLGAHLSGGIDSSLVTTLASRRCPGITAYHGRFDAGEAFDESRFAIEVAESCGARLVTLTPTEDDFIDTLPDLIWAMDEPLAGPGLFPQYMVSKRAAADVKVVLGGQGGDELFGGYARYLVAYLEQALKGAIFETYEEGEHIVSLASIVPNLASVRQYVPLLTRFWKQGLFEPMDRRYFRLIDRSEAALEMFGRDFRAAYDPERVYGRFNALFDQPHTLSYINKMLNFDLCAVLPALLHVEDRVSMAVSLESRVPLLDPRIAELVAKLPPGLKFKGGRLKYLLRQAARNVLPARVIERKDKMGFPVPLHLWARGRAADFFRDVLLSRSCRERGLYDTVMVERLLQNEEPFSRKLWGLLCLELWFQRFIDAPPATAARGEPAAAN